MQLVKKRTAFNLITGLVSMITSMGTSFFLSSYIVATIGEEANGFAQLANNFVMYASLITVAFNSMASRFMAVSYHSEEHEKTKQYYSSVLVSNLALTCLLLPCAIYIVKNLNRLIIIENANVQDVKILFACVFLNFFVGLFSSVYSISTFVTNRIYIQNAISLARNVINAILLFSVFSIFRVRIFYVSLIAVALSLVVLPITRLIQKKLIPDLRFHFADFRLSAVKETLMSGIWNTVNQCGNIMMTGLDLLLTNLFVNPAMMGVLAVAKTLPNAISILASTLNNSFAPELVMNYCRGNQKVILQQLRSNMKISSVLISIPIAVFCGFGIQFYELWMPSLDPVMLTGLSFLSCMAFVPWAGPQTLYNVFPATNHLKANSLSFITTGLLNIAIVYVLLNNTTCGVFAVAGVSSSLSILRNLIFTTPYTARLLGLRWFEFYKDVGISLLCCLITYVISLVVGKVIPIHNWFMMAVAVGIASLLALLAEMFLILNRQERRILKNKLLRRTI